MCEHHRRRGNRIPRATLIGWSGRVSRETINTIFLFLATAGVIEGFILLSFMVVLWVIKVASGL